MQYRRSGGIGFDLWGKANKRAMKAIVDSGTVPGLIAYRDKRPVGWISVGPREDYRRLERSPGNEARGSEARVVDRVLFRRSGGKGSRDNESIVAGCN
jgi:hypothetical protein